MPTVSYGIASTADDVSDATSLGSGVDNTAVLQGFLFGAYSVPAGLRFLAVAVPQGATITAATLTLKKSASQPYLGTNNGSLKGVASDNAPAWATTRPDLATKTAQSVAVVDSATVAYDVAAIVQAIVNRAGWVSGNALAFAGDTTGANGAIDWVDYSVSATDCAQLSITYEAGGPDVDPPTITSSDTLSVIEGDALSHALTASESVTWTKVGGANAAAFTLTGSTLSLSSQTYPAGPFVVVVRATDAAGNWTEQTITASVTQAPLIRFVDKATGTTSVTIPAHQAGDMIVAFAFRDGSATLPTLPTGQDWSSVLAPTGANTCSMRLAAKIADSSSEATGTFTSATSLIVHVYRPRPGTTLSVGAAASASGTSTTVSFPALTLQDAGGNSFVAGFAAHRSVNTTLESPPTGMVNRSTVVDATDEAAGHDTNGGVTSWPLTTKAVGGTSSGWFGATVEIKSVTASSSDDLTATGIASSAPTFATPTLAAKHALSASALSAGAPTFATTTLKTVQALVVAALVAGQPSLGSPTIAAVQVLSAMSIESAAPVLGSPSIAQTDVLAAASVAAGTPSLGSPAAAQQQTLSAAGISSSAPVIGVPALSSTSDLVGPDLTAGAPTFDPTSLAQIQAFSVVSISAPAPSFGSPSLSNESLQNDLAAQGIAAGTPSFGSTTVGQRQALIASTVTAGVPSIGSSSIAQTHRVTSSDLTAGAPSVGAPSLDQQFQLQGIGITAGAPSVGAPSLDQQFQLQGIGITAGAPAVGSAALSQEHALVPTGVVGAAPVLGSPEVADFLRAATPLPRRLVVPAQDRTVEAPARAVRAVASSSQSRSLDTISARRVVAAPAFPSRMVRT